MKLYKHFENGRELVLSNLNCIKVLQKVPNNYLQLVITSPPYFIGKEYDTSKSVKDFEQLHVKLFSILIDKVKEGGSICWQVGYHVNENSVVPLDFIIFNLLQKFPDLKLRNRIIWTYGHGLHSYQRFSGRHEVILWFTKGDNYIFNLDDVRIPQKYPGKKYYKGDKKGQYSGNPKGKNPSDIWSIPNVKANHIEKTIHPCQFPIGLAERLIKALTNEDDYVCDPFMGVGTSGAAAILSNRKFLGCEIETEYYNIAFNRCKAAIAGTLNYRPTDKPIFVPNGNLAVAKKPSSFKY